MNKNLILWCIVLIILIGSYIFTQTQIPKETILYLSEEEGKHGRMEVEDARKFYKNESIIGYIDIPGTSIHYFFVQGGDNIFYLNRDLRKKESILGSVFMDYRNTLMDKQINLYGHNGNVKEAPFYELGNYKKKEFIEKSPYIEVYYPEKKRKRYKIIGPLITEEKKHMNLEKEKRKENISFYNENALYKTEEITDKDSLLILQTCSYENKNTYLLLIAKEMKGQNI